MISPDDIVSLLPDFLPRQRWYGAADLELDTVALAAFEVLRPEWPVLIWLLADATFGDGSTATFQVPVGLRPLEQTERFLEGKGRSFLGDIDTDNGPALVYDALVDPDLAVELIRHIAPDEPVSRVRPLNVEQSNTSVVYDQRLIMKVFRRVAEGPNPDVEMTEALAAQGFEHISAPVAAWRRDGKDLSVVREFLDGGTVGWSLALTSLRDVYDSRVDPSEAGGNFAPEAGRLGRITAEMHLALANAFGTEQGDPESWAFTMRENLARSRARALDAQVIDVTYGQLQKVKDAGRSMRIHGDFHLGQTMRTDKGWYILDFEGEPAVPLAERRAPSSPLRDVAGMLRSFHYAAEVALVERGPASEEDELRTLGRRWEQHVAEAFCLQYFGTPGIDDLTPSVDEDRRRVLEAFVLSKAVYEVGYELAHRPDWVHIPLEAVSRLTS